jgi:FAD/FMN-containing dehydrogenase
MQTLTPETERDIIEIIQQCVNQGTSLRVIGSGKSIAEVVASNHISLSMKRLSCIVSINMNRKTVTVQPGLLIDDLCDYLWDKGFTVNGLGSVNGQTVGGIISTGSHSQGAEKGNFSTNVVGVRLIDGLGQVHVFSEENQSDIIDAIPISFGCLGVLTEVELKIVPRYFILDIRKVHPFRKQKSLLIAMLQNSPTLVRFRPDLGLAVSLTLTRFEEHSKPEQAVKSFQGYFINFTSYHKDIVLSKLQKLKMKLKLLPFRIKRFLQQKKEFQFTSQNFGYAIPVEKTELALIMLGKYFKSNFPSLLGNFSLRITKSDNLWLSQSYQRDVCHIGCYCRSEKDILVHVYNLETILIELGGRPHWGKYFTVERQDFAQLYPKWSDFLALRQKMDPHGVFHNDWTKKILNQ